MQRPQLRLQLLDTGIVMDNVVSLLQSLLPLRLCIQHGAGLFDRNVITLHEPVKLPLFIRVDDEDTIDRDRVACLEQERDDDDHIGCFGNLCYEFLDTVANRRVQDILELGSFYI